MARAKRYLHCSKEQVKADLDATPILPVVKIPS
jgi:hypothetical protein